MSVPPAEVITAVDLPSTFTTRPADPADIDALLAIATRIGELHGRPPVASHVDFEADFANPAVNIARDTIVVTNAADDTVVLGMFAHLESPGRTWLDPLIEPSLDDATVGLVLDAALQWGIDRAFDDAEERGLANVTVEAGGLRGERRLFAAFDRAGMQHARTYWRMERPVIASDATAALPDGVTISPVDPMDDDVMARLHALHEVGFAEHHGHVALTLDEFANQVLHASGFDASAAWIAQLDGVDAAIMLGNDSRLDTNVGWVDALAVLDEARGRGIARALLRTAFDYYASRGVGSVGLSVDSINPTGALRLYEGMGMAAVEIVELYELHLTVNAP